MGVYFEKLLYELGENDIYVYIEPCKNNVDDEKVILDFSNHDKVYIDKIAELESENKDLKRSLDKMNVDNGKWIENAIKWQQKYKEQKSKYADKQTNINLNDQIKVKLTPLGVEIYYHQYDELNKNIKANGGTPLEPIMPEIDKDGYTKFTLWHFMELYGQHIGMCKPNIIEPLNIYFVEV